MSTHTFYVGDVLEALKKLPSESVHCVVTSPPYWGLRDYGVEGQIGLEKTPEEYVAKLVEVFREVRRVLRHDGTLWLNLGDCYAGSGRGGQSEEKRSENWQPTYPLKQVVPASPKPKDLVGIPWMVAFALRDDGWWLRSDIIWAKPNPLPESVSDRPTKAHEYVFLLAKSERYFYDTEAIKEEAATHDIRAPHGSPGMWQMDGRPPEKRNSGKFRKQDAIGKNTYVGFNDRYVPVLKRNKRTVWEMPTQPFNGAHFATFPETLVETCILAGTSEKGCCPKCGAPWERVVERVTERYTPEEAEKRIKATGGVITGGTQKSTPGATDKVKRTTIGWRPTCSCGIDETVPCTVLDPFGGSGTVSLVAKKLGRSSIYIDLNPDYCNMAMRRLEPEQQGLFEPCEVRREVIT